MYDVKCNVNYCVYTYCPMMTNASEYLLLKTIEYLIVQTAQRTWYKMLSFPS